MSRPVSTPGTAEKEALVADPDLQFITEAWASKASRPLLRRYFGDA